MEDIIYPNGTIKNIIDLKCTNQKLNETYFLTWMQILAAIAWVHLISWYKQTYGISPSAVEKLYSEFNTFNIYL